VKYNKELIEIVCKHYETSKKECVEYIGLLKKSELNDLLELYGKNEKEIKKYFDQVTAAREYSDEEKAKKAKEKQELESSIKSLLSDLPEFTPQNQIKSKIDGFLS